MTPSTNGPSPIIATELQKGYDFLRGQRFEEGLRHAEALARSHPADPHVLVLAAEAQLANGSPAAALEWMDRAIAASDGNPFLMVKKARLMGQVRQRAEVPRLAAEISAIAGNNGTLLWQLGTLYHRNNLQAEAIAHFGKARAIIGDHPGLLYESATARFFSGDFEGAEDDIERLLAVAGDFGPALYLRATLRKQTAARNHVEDLLRRIASGFGNPDDEAAALYALAKELEDLGQHDASFEALASGAARRRGLLRYDLAAELDSLRAIQQAYGVAAMSGATAGHDEAGAIFIVGMPRSGTTLVERTLVQSGQVRSAGELLDFGNLLANATRRVLATDPSLGQAEASLRIDFATLGRDYVEGARQAAGGSRIFIDKMPVNYLYCGMIHKALPNARIIHLVRHPLDSCYAVFKTLFFNSYSFSYDQAELADYYIAYRAMMRHWHQVMPGRILDVAYEELVSDTEAQMRRIYDWCGLPWHPGVLDAPTDATVFATASAAQVREPVHNRSVGSASRHRAKLGTLVSRLSAAGLLDP
jgi:hypothetical protein